VSLAAGLTVLLFITGCEKATRQFHAFSTLEADIAQGLHVSVNAYGSWETRSEGDSVVHVSASPYVIEVRVRGGGESVAITSFQITDPSEGSSVSIDDWGTQTFSQDDAAMVFANRTGVTLSPSSKTVLGEIRVGVGADASVHTFSGRLEYEYREDQKNRFLQRIRGI
jgi:hypothetical protein